ncbi:GntR family transcriptional regulator [Campylobacter ureolyticus]|jgi:bacterial regulatory protein, asnC family:bacterial regulatory protein, gntR family|uniref:GntR family transcriptional regulator n=1 Tax=Campylobacter ureolyticus TaxID=827 RepID=UPI0022B2D441|nr:GntR family transcriptional regulator [Campylobacter ureolyticus]MCZ6117103.1 GntR family transcriptional regulator [Campylobacter ureolyticus]
MEKPKTVAEFVAECLRKDILLGEIKSGTRLKQDEISKQLNVSSTPVREAIKILVVEGLLSFDSYRGAVVKNLNYQDAKDIYDLRLDLEQKLIKRSFLKYDESFLIKAKEIQKDIEQCTNIYDWAILNSYFHSSFWEIENESKLYNIVENLMISSVPYISLTLMYKKTHKSISNKEHNELIKAYEEKNLKHFIEINYNHTKKTRDIIEEAIEEKNKNK